MTLRVTNGMTASVVLGDIQATSARMAALQQKLSSGKELTNAADDPYAVSRAMQLRNDLGSNQQYQRNVTQAASWHEVTDATLSHITDYVLRARDLVVQGASGTTGPSGRSAIQSELENPLAKAILEGRFAPKDRIYADFRGGRMVFEKKPARAAA